ncbi:MAG: hypothetical protein U0Q12_02955 [Vicinamibacterales bacterium]
MERRERERAGLWPAAFVGLSMAAGGTALLGPRSSVPAPVVATGQAEASARPVESAPADPKRVGRLSGARSSMKLVADFLGVQLVAPESSLAADTLVNYLAADTRERVRKTAADWRAWLRARGAEPEPHLDGALAGFFALDSPPMVELRTRAKALIASASTEADDAVDRHNLNAIVDTTHARDIRLDFLIATIPDYVDSNVSWFADGSVDAIQRAIAQFEFVVDRFYLPDWLKSPDGAQKTHEVEPGAILFRQRLPRDARAFEKSQPDLLLVLLVPEAPTLGIHKRPFVTAVHLIGEWRAADGDRDPRPLRVLGPTFSGSATSLRLAIESAAAERAASMPEVRVVSGSASDDRNGDIIQTGWPLPREVPPLASPLRVTYATTTRSTTDIMRALAAYLTAIGAYGECGDEAALLVESNTSYGGGVAPFTELSPGSCDSPFARAVQFQFPLQISRLRSQARAVRTGEAKDKSAAVVSLRMDEPTLSLDQLPAFTPSLTSASVEIVIGEILDSIRRRHTRAIGIFATDQRDFLFLAEQISRHAPDLLVFTTAAHSLYLHADYAAFTRGSIVATSYPVFSDTEGHTNVFGSGWRLRTQFTDMMAAGVYNAAVLLLREPGLGASPVGDAGKRPPLVDYARLGCDGDHCLPPIWITEVGRDGHWPVAVYSGRFRESKRSDEPSLRREAASPTLLDSSDRFAVAATDGATAPEAVHVSLVGGIVFWAILAMALGHVGLYWWGRRSRTNEWSRPFVGVFLPRGFVTLAYHQVELLCLVTVGVLLAFITPFGLVWASHQSRLWAWPLRALAYSALAGLLVTIVGLLGEVGSQAVRSKRTALARHAAAAASQLILGGWTAFTFLTLPVDWYTVARVAHPANWISPGPAVVLAGAALYMWAVWNLRRLRHVGTGVGYSSLDEVLIPVIGGDVWRLAKALVISPLNATLGWTLVVATIVVLSMANSTEVVSMLDVGLARPVVILDTVVVAVVAATLLQRYRAWLALRDALTRTARHAIGPAFARVASEPFDWRLSLAPARVTDFVPLVRRLRHLVDDEARLMSSRPERDQDAFLDDVRHAVEAAEPRAPRAVAVAVVSGGSADGSTALMSVANEREGGHERGEAKDAAEACAHDVWAGPTVDAWRSEANDALKSGGTLDALASADADEPCPLLQSAVALGLAAVSAHLVRALDTTVWAGGLGAPTAERKAWFERAEDLLTLHSAFVIRDVLSRIISGLFVLMTASFVLLVSHLFYSFAGRHLLLVIDWLLVGAVGAVSTLIFVQMEKDTTLSRLWSTDAGKLNLRADFVTRVVAYGIIPVLTFFAAQFPELGVSLFSWLDPVRSVLP